MADKDAAFQRVAGKIPGLNRLQTRKVDLEKPRFVLTDQHIEKGLSIARLEKFTTVHFFERTQQKFHGGCRIDLE